MIANLRLFAPDPLAGGPNLFSPASRLATIVSMDGQDPGRQTAIFLVWFLCGISLLIVLLRLGSRIFIVRILALDDLLIIPAMAFGIAMAVMAYVAYRDGTDQVLRTALSYIQVVPFYLSQMFGRISFAVTLLDIMGTDRFRRRLIYALIALQFVVCLIGLATALGPCQHVSDQWTSWDMGPDSCFAKQMRVSMNGSQWFISIADALFDIGQSCSSLLSKCVRVEWTGKPEFRRSRLSAPR